MRRVLIDFNESNSYGHISARTDKLGDRVAMLDYDGNYCEGTVIATRGNGFMDIEPDFTTWVPSPDGEAMVNKLRASTDEQARLSREAEVIVRSLFKNNPDFHDVYRVDGHTIKVWFHRALDPMFNNEPFVVNGHNVVGAVLPHPTENYVG